jgi:hypothetical protein
MKSVWLENKGKDGFILHSLPVEAQFAPVYGIQVLDLNGDAYPEIVLIGNDFGMETSQGRADALNGLVLENKGNGQFHALGFEESGFFVPGDARALALVNVKGTPHLAATQNRRGLSMFSLSGSGKTYKLEPTECYGELTLTNNRKQVMEWGWGSSFLSQNSRTWVAPKQLVSLTIKDGKGNTTRTLKP